MSKADDIKKRMKNRDARSSLMGNTMMDKNPSEIINDNINNDINNNVNNDINNNVNNDINNNVNNDVSNNENADKDIYAIINKKSNTKSEKKLVGIYFDPEVKKALDKLQKVEGRGAKSELVNDITKWALEQKGLL